MTFNDALTALQSGKGVRRPGGSVFILQVGTVPMFSVTKSLWEMHRHVLIVEPAPAESRNPDAPVAFTAEEMAAKDWETVGPGTAGG
jgi:hypothetical protein